MYRIDIKTPGISFAIDDIILQMMSVSQLGVQGMVVNEFRIICGGSVWESV